MTDYISLSLADSFLKRTQVEREIDRGLATVGKRVVSYWPAMQCGRAEWWRVEC